MDISGVMMLYLPLLVLAACVVSAKRDDDTCNKHISRYFMPYGDGTTDVVATPETIGEAKHQYNFSTTFTAFGQVYSKEGYKIKMRKDYSLGVIRVKPTTGFRNPGTFDIRAARLRYTKGKIYMRSTKFVTDLQRVNDLINEAYPCLKTGPFNALEVSVITYHCMEYDEETHTFQVVLAVDDVKTYVVFNYHKLFFNESLQYGIKDRSTDNTYKISGGNVDNQYVLMAKTNGIRPGVWVVDVSDSFPRRPESCPKYHYDCTMTQHALVNTFDGAHFRLPDDSYKVLSSHIAGPNNMCNFIIRAKTTYQGTVKYIDISLGSYNNDDQATMYKFVFGREEDTVQLIDPTLPEVSKNATQEIPKDGFFWPPLQNSQQSPTIIIINKSEDSNSQPQVSWTVQSSYCGYEFTFRPVTPEPVFKLTFNDAESYRWNVKQGGQQKVDGICGNFNGDVADD